MTASSAGELSSKNYQPRFLPDNKRIRRDGRCGGLHSATGRVRSSAGTPTQRRPLQLREALENVHRDWRPLGSTGGRAETHLPAKMRRRTVDSDAGTRQKPPPTILSNSDDPGPIQATNATSTLALICVKTSTAHAHRTHTIHVRSNIDSVLILGDTCAFLS